MTRPQAMNLARQMWADGTGGWTIEAIKNYLARHGISVGWGTVKRWVDEDYAQATLERNRERARAEYRERNGVTGFLVIDADARRRLGIDAPEPPSRLTPDLLLALREEDGLTYTAIAAVARRFFGEDKTEDQWRHRLYDLGASKDPNKARPRSTVA